MIYNALCNCYYKILNCDLENTSVLHRIANLKICASIAYERYPKTRRM